MSDYYEEGYREEQDARDFFMKKHGHERRWYSKYGLSDREEDNLVMDEIEGESKELEK